MNENMSENEHCKLLSQGRRRGRTLSRHLSRDSPAAWRPLRGRLFTYSPWRTIVEKIWMWRVLPLRKKQQRQYLMNWLKPPFSTPLCSLEIGDWENRSEVEPGKKGGVGRRCFKNLVYFQLPYSEFIGNKLIHFPHDGNGWVISLCPYLDSQAFCCIFYSQCNRGEW